MNLKQILDTHFYVKDIAGKALTLQLCFSVTWENIHILFFQPNLGFSHFITREFVRLMWLLDAVQKGEFGELYKTESEI